MDVAFVNKYTVSKEGHSVFFVQPQRRPTRPSASKSASPVGAKIQKWNVWIRALGLALALIIIFMAIMQRTWILAVVGAILVAIYVIRIYQARDAEKEAKARAVPPPSPQFDASGKWTRYVRFGDHIEKEDPSQTKEYQYSQITRISDDPAYLTLWMDDNTQVRVLKTGFIIGTLDGFKQFIMARAGRLIGPGKPGQPAEAKSSEPTDTTDEPEDAATISDESMPEAEDSTDAG